MSNKEDPANLIIAVVAAIAGLFVCLIIAAAVFDLGTWVEQTPDSNLLSPSPQLSQ
jgi:hypothetical protein